MRTLAEPPGATAPHGHGGLRSAPNESPPSPRVEPGSERCYAGPRWSSDLGCTFHCASTCQRPGTGRELEDSSRASSRAASYFASDGVTSASSTTSRALDAVALAREPQRRAPCSWRRTLSSCWGFPTSSRSWGGCHTSASTRAASSSPQASAPHDLGSVNRSVGPLGFALVDLADFHDPCARFRRSRASGYLREPRLTRSGPLLRLFERILLESASVLPQAAPEALCPRSALAYHDLIQRPRLPSSKPVTERPPPLRRRSRPPPRLSLSVAGELAAGPSTRAGRPSKHYPQRGDVTRQAPRAPGLVLHLAPRPTLDPQGSVFDLLCQE